METPESIRTSLQKGKWVTSIDFKEAYFHIPINPQSRKYLHFHMQGQFYQFKALPLGLSTAPMEIRTIVKKVKLMAQNKSVRIHQYLDDWWIRNHIPPNLSHSYLESSSCVSGIRLDSKHGLELEPKQVFKSVGYQYDLREGKIRPTLESWQTLNNLNFLSDPYFRAKQLISLIGLLIATKKQVHLGWLHVRWIQWQIQKSLEDPRITRKGDLDCKVSPATLKMEAPRSKCPSRPDTTHTQ